MPKVCQFLKMCRISINLAATKMAPRSASQDFCCSESRLKKKVRSLDIFLAVSGAHEPKTRTAADTLMCVQQLCCRRERRLETYRSADHSIIFRKFNEATANMRISKSTMTATSSGRSARLPVIISPRTASTAYVSGLKTATIWMARGINAIG